MSSRSSVYKRLLWLETNQFLHQILEKSICFNWLILFYWKIPYNMPTFYFIKFASRIILSFSFTRTSIYLVVQPSRMQVFYKNIIYLFIHLYLYDFILIILKLYIMSRVLLVNYIYFVREIREKILYLLTV